MSIKITCPICTTTLSTSDDAAGSKIACPNCDQRLLVPATTVKPASRTVPAKPARVSLASPTRLAERAQLSQRPARARSSILSSTWFWLGSGALSLTALAALVGGLFLFTVLFPKPKDLAPHRAAVIGRWLPINSTIDERVWTFYADGQVELVGDVKDDNGRRLARDPIMLKGPYRWIDAENVEVIWFGENNYRESNRYRLVLTTDDRMTVHWPRGAAGTDRMLQYRRMR